MKRNMLLLSALCLGTICLFAQEAGEAKVSSKGKYIRLRVGVRIFPAGHVAFHQVPEEFEGYMIMLRENGSQSPIEFTVKEAGIVTLAAEIQVAKELMAQGWVQVNTLSVKAQNSSPYECPILQKKLDAGVYSIPCNGDRLGVRLLKR